MRVFVFLISIVHAQQYSMNAVHTANKVLAAFHAVKICTAHRKTLINTQNNSPREPKASESKHPVSFARQTSHSFPAANTAVKYRTERSISVGKAASLAMHVLAGAPSILT